ncbi:MAG TPA: dethiobiotin synthase [Acidimicrobiales bacterium]|nr:dethiobiotin synthase [Acidimicrobiales bacterium]
MSDRPAALVVVAGTATEVGKTWVGARLLEHWRARGLRVAARKPAQSFGLDDDPATTDAAVLGAASGEPPEVVCLPDRSYPLAMAPPMAARALGRAPLHAAALLSELRWPEPAADVGLVETAGGLRSPQTEDADALELAGAIDPDLTVLVADAGLGTINAVRLCTDALTTSGLAFVVVLNRFDESDALHLANREWLTQRHGLDVVAGTPAGLASLSERIALRTTAR